MLFSSSLILLLVGSAMSDMNNDNKATESDPTGSLIEPPMEKESKVTEKRAPIHLTAVPGMNPLAGISQPYPYKYFYDSSLSATSKAPIVLKTTAAPTHSYQHYLPLSHQHVHGGFNLGPMMVLMAAQHPSGYTMLIPATLIPHPVSMFNYMYLPQYSATPSPVYSQPLPTKSYSSITTGSKSNFGQLSANAGFAAQHQLLYSGPGFESSSTGSDGSSQTKSSPEPFSNRLRGLEPYIKG